MLGMFIIYRELETTLAQARTTQNVNQSLVDHDGIEDWQ
jgi:hypothetical protein